MGECVDLAHAYRQVAVRRSHSSCAVIRVRSAEGTVDWFRQAALPYGAKGSVWGFNRPARAISALIVRIVWICIPNYFDDFVNLEADVLSANADAAIARLMKIIGWEVKGGGDKEFPFSMTFDALGVRFGLRNALPAGLLLIGNKAGKCEDLISDTMIILDSGVLSASKAAQLMGRLCGTVRLAHLWPVRRQSMSCPFKPCFRTRL